MSGKSREYAAFQQLDSAAETYQFGSTAQQPHLRNGEGAGGSQAFMALDYHVSDGYCHGMPQRQPQHHHESHHSLLMPNHQFYANNNSNTMNDTYRMMLQTQFNQRNSHNMTYYNDMGNSNHHNASPNLSASYANFDPLPVLYSGGAHHQRTTSWDEFMSLNSALFQPENNASSPPATVSAQQSYSSNAPATGTATEQYTQEVTEENSWLTALMIEVSGLSMDPLSGSEVVERCQASMDDVLNRYVPCVDFLVQCQQDLRRGQRICVNNAQDFFLTFVQPLPGVFYGKNRYTFSAEPLQAAMEGLNQLVRDAKAAQRMGSEAVKNHFLGGMKDGESWGLRKWLSRQGNALQICTNLECVLSALRKLDKSADSTRKLASILRPIAKKTLHRLKTGVPESYQERSSAHPYLPFFHRLEAALRSMSQFEPEADDVICLDDSDEDDDEPQCVAPPPTVKKRKADVVLADIGDGEHERKPAAKLHPDSQPAIRGNGGGNRKADNNLSSSGESDNESVVEIVNTTAATASERISDGLWAIAASTPPRQEQRIWPLPIRNKESVIATAERIANNLDRVAEYFDSGQQAILRPITAPHGSFWDGTRYARVLRIFTTIIRSPEAVSFIERVDEDALIQTGFPPFSHVIKHPLSFRDISASLIWNVDANDSIPCGKDGVLPVLSLKKWNMWKGMDLVQAIDLVFLNSLAYGKHLNNDKRSPHRSSTNKLRKMLWDEIGSVILAHAGSDAFRRKSVTPTRRSETSGFIVYKIQE